MDDKYFDHFEFDPIKSTAPKNGETAIAEQASETAVARLDVGAIVKEEYAEERKHQRALELASSKRADRQAMANAISQVVGSLTPAGSVALVVGGFVFIAYIGAMAALGYFAGALAIFGLTFVWGAKWVARLNTMMSPKDEPDRPRSSNAYREPPEDP